MPTIQPEYAVDFHLHTLASDGGWTVEALIEHLAERSFRIAAVCDHDTMASVPHAVEFAQRLGLTIVPGVEVTTRWDGRQWHVLVYGIDPVSSSARAFRAILDELADRLWAASVDAVITLERKGYRLRSLREVAAGRPLRPYHVLVTLIREGYATNLATAHELTKRLGEPMQVDVPLERVVAAAHATGGVCILAHPGRDDGVGVLDEETLGRLLAAVPIDGLEVYYRSHSAEQSARFRSWCERFGLLASAGSDSHAPGVPVDPIPYRAAWVAGLLERLGFDVPIPLEQTRASNGKYD
ncbi:PHP domain-containing protein [Thermomicrobium sp. 4228-Ro]|uniref:PHP domain-containing protein n=1 Tax=Thermomicrobium sp. 4228-Ro TaxID=2993937 RepID=UPI0022488B0C|nr:PHP domain-containing protein [Thermomicrobium sp. 4228-Ro]MCX2727553.1 PHP domain-containing protein [Thermomicrobium sp. 4228-Ro]